MKHATYSDYSKQPKESLNLPEQALLSVWDALSPYRSDLALVGGLAVRYLTNQPQPGLPGPVTMDVDFGINIAAGSGMYGNIRDKLSGHGFQWQNNRFVRDYPEKDFSLYIDLLTDDGKSHRGSAVVDDGLTVGLIPGVERALACTVSHTLTGKNLVNALVSQTIKMADVGPMLVMKLNAFGGLPDCRKHPKDAHEFLYLVENYSGGVQAAVDGFKAEKIAENRGMPFALECLKKGFNTPDAEGPLACASFRLGNNHKVEDPSQSKFIRERCVTLAEALLNA